MTLGYGWQLTKKALTAWNDDNALSLGAALAYLAAFSISPLMVITLAVRGFIYRQHSFSYIRSAIAGLLGNTAATAIASAITSVRHFEHGVSVTVFGFAALFLGASAVFVQLQNSLN